MKILLIVLSLFSVMEKSFGQSPLLSASPPPNTCQVVDTTSTISSAFYANGSFTSAAACLASTNFQKPSICSNIFSGKPCPPQNRSYAIKYNGAVIAQDTCTRTSCPAATLPCYKCFNAINWCGQNNSLTRDQCLQSNSTPDVMKQDCNYSFAKGACPPLNHTVTIKYGTDQIFQFSCPRLSCSSATPTPTPSSSPAASPKPPITSSSAK